MELEWERLTVRSEQPFRISRSTRSSFERVWVRVSADGVEGWGEAAPTAYYGESADSVEAALAEIRPALADHGDPRRLEPLEGELLRRAPDAASARAGVVAAVLDLVGKALGEPLWRLWGLDPGEAPASSFTLGIDEPEVMAEKARRAAGYPVLKVKVGTDRDRENLEAIRSEAPDALLRVDANAAWTADEALEGMELLTDFGVEFVEQPLPPDDREGYRRLAREAPLPVIVDESCLVAADVPGLAGLADGVNLKLAKCGGPREALRAIHTARACGLEVMLGCMVQSSLGIAAAAHLSPLVDYADLDGAALLADDPFTGPGFREGRIVLGEEPGLGVSRA